ncbi:MAG: outer membrane protein assembly factor BamD [Paracoccaceae bacterium]|jgi:outer membrane protein assembly factor BamD
MASVRARAGLIGAIMLSGLISGCSGAEQTPQEAMEQFTAEQIFERGEFELASRDPEKAADFFAEVERLYPYSELAKRALIMQAFSFHQHTDYESSRAAAQRYIDFYPADEDAAYAQYLLALSYYDQIDEVGRDQGLTFQALQSLRTVIELYPNSEYARSSMLKFDLAFDHLAAKEMEIGRYYLRREHYTAAINRFRVVIEEFQTTAHTPEALHRLAEAYLALGLDEEAQTAGAILAYNFQASPWYEDTYQLLVARDLEAQAVGNGWLQQIYSQMIKGRWI